MSALSAFRRVGVIAFGPALAAAGCLPIRGTVLLSPPVVGVYRGPDGAPVPGARFSLATAFGDSTCAAPTLHATTDSAGVFRFPATEQHYRWVLLVPFDARAPEYTLCAQAGEALRPVYRGVVHGAAPLPAPARGRTGQVRPACGLTSL